MHDELLEAANFIIKVMKMSHGGYARQIGESKLEEFKKAIREGLKEKYTGHWHPETSHKGSGYRCIKIGTKMDPTIEKAARKVGLKPDSVLKAFTTELTMWVDPREVTYRLGHDGSFCTLYEYKPTTTSKSTTPTSNPVSVASSTPSKVASTQALVSASSMSVQAPPFVQGSSTPTKRQLSYPVASSSSNTIQDLPFVQTGSVYHSTRQFSAKENYPPSNTMISQNYPPSNTMISQNYPPSNTMMSQNYPPTNPMSSQNYPANTINSQQQYSMSNQQHYSISSQQLHSTTNQHNWSTYSPNSYLPRHGPVPSSPIGLNSYPDSTWINTAATTEGMTAYSHVTGLMATTSAPYSYSFNDQEINQYGEASSAYESSNTEQNR